MHTHPAGSNVPDTQTPIFKFSKIIPWSWEKLINDIVISQTRPCVFSSYWDKLTLWDLWEYHFHCKAFSVFKYNTKIKVGILVGFLLFYFWIIIIDEIICKLFNIVNFHCFEMVLYNSAPCYKGIIFYVCKVRYSKLISNIRGIALTTCWAAKHLFFCSFFSHEKRVHVKCQSTVKVKLTKEAIFKSDQHSFHYVLHVFYYSIQLTLPKLQYIPADTWRSHSDTAL